MSTIALATPRHRTRAKSTGFTLLEIMVVVAIIAIIVGIIAPNFGYARSKAQVAATEAVIKAIATAVEMYYSDYKVFPGTTGWQSVSPAMFGGAGNKYFNDSPILPGNPYSVSYSYCGNCAAGGDTGPYYIASAGPFDPAVLQNFTKVPWFGGGSCGLTCTQIVWGPSIGFEANP